MKDKDIADALRRHADTIEGYLDGVEYEEDLQNVANALRELAKVMDPA